MSWPRAQIASIKANTPNALVGGPFGSDLTTRDYVPEGIPVIRGQNLSAGCVFTEEEFVYVSAEKAAQLRANTAGRGDLVFTQRGTLGQVGLIPTTSRFARYVISQSQMKLTVDPKKADARFVYHYFSLPAVVEEIKARAITSGVPHINLGILKELEIPLPPIEVQGRISSIASAYDDLIGNNQRRIKLLEEAARRLYREWFVALRFPGNERVKVVDGVPQGWTRRTVGDVCKAVGGATPATGRPEYWDGDVTWLTPTDVTRNGCLFLTASTRKITAAGLKSCSSQLMPPGTIFMTSRASIGYFAILDHAACTNQGFISVLPTERLSREFLLFHLMSRVGEFISRATGSTFLELSKKTFRAMECVWPSAYVIEQYSRQVAPMLGQIEVLKKQLDAAEQARDALLPRLMSGALAV